MMFRRELRSRVRLWSLGCLRYRGCSFVVFDILAFAQIRAFKFWKSTISIVVVRITGFFEILLYALPCTILSFLEARVMVLSISWTDIHLPSMQ